MSIYAHPDFASIQREILADPGNEFRRWILRDWLLDYGVDDPKALEVIEPPTLSQYLSTDYYGSVSGIGRGSVSGIGRGRGIGSGRGIIMEIGKAYLVITVDWFAWVGRVKRQIGPWEYKMASCSKISETNNGDNWQHLCAGDLEARKACSYQHYSIPVILGIGAVAKVLWVGETPQEQGL